MECRRTSLYEKHIEAQGRMINFFGWELPVQYTSILEEHMYVRENCGIFDVSHMGKIQLKGKGAYSLLECLSTNHLENLEEGACQYNLFLNEKGGVIDDVIIYKVHLKDFFIVCNASNTKTLLEHLEKFAKEKNYQISLSNVTLQWQQIAIQGPLAQTITENTIEKSLENLAYFTFQDHKISEKESIRIARTGYTGEDGFEIYAPSCTIAHLWSKFQQNKALPIGLGARNSLRLEVFYPLYGNELKAEWTPLESRFAWVVKEKSKKFIGIEKILEQKAKGVPGKIWLFVLEEGLARPHYPIWEKEKKRKIGEVLSAVYSPVLKKGIGSVYIEEKYQFSNDAEILVDVRNRFLPAKIKNKALVPVKAGKK